MKIDRAVIVAAGRGTRFLPVTRSIPKEMLPLVNKPLIQYAVEEVVESGIERVVIVTAPGKHSLADYFSPSPELESFLKEKGKAELLGEIQRLGRGNIAADTKAIDRSPALDKVGNTLRINATANKNPYLVKTSQIQSSSYLFD